VRALCGCLIRTMRLEYIAILVMIKRYDVRLLSGRAPQLDRPSLPRAGIPIPAPFPESMYFLMI